MKHYFRFVCMPGMDTLIVVIKPQYMTVPYGFFEGLASVGTGTGLAYIDKTGQVILKTPYSDAHQFSEGLAPVEINEKWGFIDKNGKIVIEPRFLKPMTVRRTTSATGAFYGVLGKSTQNYPSD